ncbi:MAG: TIGR04222 domain-containing membrane protein [Bryobacterales bacterium]|nr:TIGR04222 domain-containing membrane protein [Bryobacterales bacterium]
MNPFDLRGPEFLVLYGVMALAVIMVAFWKRRMREDADGRPLPKLEDPYLIAYLRGGREGAIETALVSLVDRKHIVVEDGQMVAMRTKKIEHPLEKALLGELGEKRKARDARRLSCKESMDGYASYLLKQGLLPDGNQKAARLWDTAVACVVLVGVAMTKIAVALARGRTNILFLVLLMVISVVVAIVVCNPRLTSRGKRALENMQALLARLKGRADTLRPNEDTQDLMLLAAVFGVMAIPVTAMPQREMMYPANTASSSSGGDSGSSCGSSCGGGCGGGCGGCGS